MKRQKTRSAILLISFLLFPVTLYYLSPYLIIQAGLEGIISGSFIYFVLLFIGSLFFGRACCGWVCPAGGLQACAAAVNDKRFRGGKRNLIKYIIWVPWLVSIVLIFINAKGFRSIDPLYFTDHGISVAGAPGYITYFGVVGLILIMSLISGRFAFCHCICWMAPFMIIGSKIKNAFKYPSLHLEADSAKCINCKSCTRKCPMSLEVNEMVKENKMCDTECILCGQCVDSCTKGAINFKFRWNKIENGASCVKKE